MFKRTLRISALWAMAVCLAAAQAAAQGFNIRPHLNNITPDGATLIWETPEPGESVVEFGREGSLDRRATGEADEHGIHRVRMTGLDAETAYRYRVAAGDEVAEGTFKTAPSEARPITFVVIGDPRRWAGTWEATDMAAHAAQWAPEFYINNGDLVLNGHDRSLWPEHFTRFESLAGNLWIAPVRGNHEGSMIFDAENDWYARYHEFPGAGEPYASFTWGNTHFVLISYEQLLKADEFLDEHLPGVDSKYTVVCQHYPVYCTGYFGADDPRKEMGLGPMAKYAEAQDRHNVDVNISGHTHIYERLFALRGGARDDRNGTSYLVNGGDIGSNWPEAFTAVRDDKATMAKPTYTVFHMGNDRIWFRSFAWSTVEERIVEIDYHVIWRDEAVPRAVFDHLPELDAEGEGEELIAAITELGAMMYAPAAPALLAYLGHEEAPVRHAAATAIRRIGSTEMAARLLDYLDVEDLAVRREAARTLEIASKPAQAPAIAAAARDTAQDPATRVHLIGALQFHAPPRLATDTLVAVLREEDAPEIVRQRAAYALARTAAAEDLATLVDLFAVDPSPYVVTRLTLALNEICGRRQPVGEKGPIGESKPGERGAFIQKWLDSYRNKGNALPAELERLAS